VRAMNETGTPRFRSDIILALVTAALVVLLALAVRDALGLLPLGLASIFLLYPHRREPLAMRLLAVAIAFTLLWALRRLGPVLTPFIVAFLLAYLLDPLVRKLTEWRLPRPLAAAVPLVAALAVIVLVAVFVLPPIVTQGIELVSRLPDLVLSALDRLEPVARRWTVRFGGEDGVRRIVPQLFEPIRQMLSKLQEGIPLVGRGLGFVFSIVSFLVLVPILTFYLLNDFPKIRRGIAESVPARWRDSTFGFVAEMDDLLSKYVRGQAISALIVGIEAITFLTLLGIPYSLALGALTGVMNLVPIVGFWISFVPPLLLVLAGPEPWSHLLRLVPVFLVIQFLDSYVVAPRVVGKRVGLHPVVILLAVLAFPIYLGPFGVLIAIPAVAVLTVILRRLNETYRAHGFYTSEREPPGA